MNVQVIGTEVRAMFGSIAHRYDLTNTVLSLGIHHLWRHKLVRLVEADPKLRVLDLCTGTGDLLPILRKRFGSAVGVDFCMPMLRSGRKKSASPLLLQGDALSLPFPDDTFDLVTVAFGVRNFENLERGLNEIKRILSNGGTLLVLEFGEVPPTLFGKLYKLYSKSVIPLIGGFLTGNYHAYSYLPETANAFPSGERFNGVLLKCGFMEPLCMELSGGIAFAYRAKC